MISRHRKCSRSLKKAAIAVLLNLGLTTSLAIAAPLEAGFQPDKATMEAERQAVLHNGWIEKLPYVTDVQPAWQEGRDESKKLMSVDYVIVVMTDTDDHQASLERQVPASLEGFPLVVLVDPYPKWELERKKMMATVKPVIDNPANKWILKVPHVTRMFPATINGDHGEPKAPAVGIAVDHGRAIKQVRSEIPKVGGFPTTFGWVDNGSDCFTSTGEGCDHDR